jgi:hypothetical protein
MNTESVTVSVFLRAFGRLGKQPRGNRARYFVEALLIFSGGTTFGETNFQIDMHLDGAIPVDD